MTIQVKAKGISTNRIAFSYSETQSDHLFVLELDFDAGIGRAIYNGPEHYVREYLPKEPWKEQKAVSVSQLRDRAYHRHTYAPGPATGTGGRTHTPPRTVSVARVWQLCTSRRLRSIVHAYVDGVNPHPNFG